MPKAGRSAVWIMMVGVALVTQGCWEEEPGGLALLGDGGCRMANGSEGTPTTIGVQSSDECQAKCLTDGAAPCVAVEYNANSSSCEVHREPITKFEKIEGVACYVMK
jgi:PAN domain